LNTQMVTLPISLLLVSLTLLSQGKRCSGTLPPMYSGRQPKDTMDVTYASARRLMMGFFTRWQLTIGDTAVFLLINRFLCTTPGRVVTNADYPLLEKVAESAIKDRQKFERLLVSKEKLLEMFHVS